MNIFFINHGEFCNNSHWHILGFAKGLAALGHNIFVIASGIPPQNEHGVTFVDARILLTQGFPDEIKNALKDRNTIVHAWTPRSSVCAIVKAMSDFAPKYIVHLEDDELLVTATQLRLDVRILLGSGEAIYTGQIPPHLSDPSLSKSFMKRAAGITVIVDTLAADAPNSAPLHILEPGIDSSEFTASLSEGERNGRRNALGFSDSSTVLLYHGGVHPAVQRDLFSLYAAIRMLRKQFDVHLLRAGTIDFTTQKSIAFKDAFGVVNVGYLSRESVPELLDLADIYVQPGWINPFNAKRLPSKLLEFLSMGRPTLTPPTNIGRLLEHRKTAMILKEGGATPIVNAVSELIANPHLSAAIGREGRKFAEQQFRFSDKVGALFNFYSQIVDSTA